MRSPWSSDAVPRRAPWNPSACARRRSATGQGSRSSSESSCWRSAVPDWKMPSSSNVNEVPAAGHDAVRRVLEPGRMLDPVHLVVGLQDIEPQVGTFVRLPLQRDVEAFALAIEIELAPARAGRARIRNSSSAPVLMFSHGTPVAPTSAALRRKGRPNWMLSVRVDNSEYAISIRAPNVPKSVSQVLLSSSEACGLVSSLKSPKFTLPVRPAVKPSWSVRFARTQVDRARNTAFDHVRGRVLVRRRRPTSARRARLRNSGRGYCGR